VDAWLHTFRLECGCGNVRWLAPGDVFQVDACKPCVEARRKEKRNARARRKRAERTGSQGRSPGPDRTGRVTQAQERTAQTGRVGPLRCREHEAPNKQKRRRPMTRDQRNAVDMMILATRMCEEAGVVVGVLDKREAVVDALIGEVVVSQVEDEEECKTPVVVLRGGDVRFTLDQEMEE
jgi:hypothetical protein